MSVFHKPTDDDMIPVLINNCFGGFGISKIACDAYNQLVTAIDPDAKRINSMGMGVDRHDPFLVAIFSELGSERFSDKHSKIEIEMIPKKYENYYHISEYDGIESIDFNYYYYMRDEISKIVYEEESNAEQKIEKIKQIVPDERKILEKLDEKRMRFRQKYGSPP